MSSPVLWLTGLPGSGKSTLSQRLHERLGGSVVLRIDEIRKYMTPSPTYSEEERELVYRALIYTALKISELGHVVIIDATGNLRRWREFAKSVIKRFAEIYIQCPLEICIGRERTRQDSFDAPSNIYRKAAEGWPVPGVNAPYEEPLNPILTIHSNETTIDNAVDMIMNLFDSI